jgi:endonuclease G, mitochondrial
MRRDVDNRVPLAKLLNNAIILAAGVPEETVFRQALEKVSADGAASPAGAAGDAPATRENLDVAALPVADGDLEVQIGEDDTLTVDFLYEGTAVSRSVARLLVHRHFDGHPSMLPGDKPDFGNGTGWMLAPQLLITNFHVVRARRPLEPISADDFQLQGAATRVQFDYYRTNPKLQETRSAGCVASADAPARPPLRSRTSLILKPQERALRERVNVLQHPNGDPMRLGFRNSFVVSGTESRLSYLTDTAGGSSGSPICDDAWFVAALHRGFTTITGEPPKVWGKAIRQENYGTPIGWILEHLATHHPDLHAEVETGQIALRQDGDT